MNNLGKEKCLDSGNYQGINTKQGDTLTTSANPTVPCSKMEVIIKVVREAHNDAVLSCEHLKLLGGIFRSIKSMSGKGSEIDILAEIGMYFVDTQEGNYVYHEEQLKQQLAQLDGRTL